VSSPLLGELRDVAVLRALPGIGDLLCAMPALRAFRIAYPETCVTLIGVPEAETLIARFGSYVDELAPFPGFPGVPEVPFDARRTTAFVTRAQAREFDLAVQLHGSGRTTNAFVALLAARRTAGFVLPGFPCPDPELFVPYPADRPEPLRHLALMEHLGLPVDDPTLEFPLWDEDRAEAERLLAGHGSAGNAYACINVGASLSQRRWPIERFATVADGLAERGVTPVLVGVAGEEPLTSATAVLMRSPAVDLAGASSVGGLAALLAGARVTVTNDTGTSHLAAAVGAPSVVIFSASDPRRWAPLDGRRHRALGTAIGVSPDDDRGRCLRDGCRRRGDPLVTDVRPAQVLEQCDALMAGAGLSSTSSAASRAS
jgi:ADP-heptose:LPS heptosyltransferase